MRRSNKKTLKRRPGKYKQSWSAKQDTCRASGRELPYKCTAQDALAGLLTPASMTPTATGGEYTDLNPAYFGDRCAQLSRLYNQWKLNKLVVTFRPSAPLGIAMTTYSTSALRAFAGFAGFTLDPTIGALTQTEIVESGGKEFNFGKISSWTLTASKWMWVQPTVGDVLPDTRFYSLGHFNTSGAQNGPNPSVEWGVFEFNWDVSFRWPIDADAEVSMRDRAPPSIQQFRKTMKINQSRVFNSRLVCTKDIHEESKESTPPIFVEQDSPIAPPPSQSATVKALMVKVPQTNKERAVGPRRE